MIYHDVSWFIMIYHDISWYIMISHCFGWSQWRMSLSHWFLSNKSPHTFPRPKTPPQIMKSGIGEIKFRPGYFQHLLHLEGQGQQVSEVRVEYWPISIRWLHLSINESCCILLLPMIHCYSVGRSWSCSANSVSHYKFSIRCWALNKQVLDHRRISVEDVYTEDMGTRKDAS